LERAEGREVHLVEPGLTIRCGDRMRVRGMRVGEEIAASLVDLTTAPRTASACSTIGVQRVAIILLNFPGQSLPSNVNATSLRGALLGATNSVDGHWREASYGLTSAAGDVIGPFTLAQSYTCSQTDQIRTAGIAAADASVDLTQYTRLIFVFPGNCGGLGTIGCRNNTSPSRGSFTASAAWLGQDFAGNAGLATCALVHEIGHGMGLSHASSLAYGAEVLGGLNASGTHDEYGDRYSLMGLCYGTGSGYLMGHFAAQQKQSLGWLAASNLQQVEAGGTFTLAPYELSTNALQALRIRRGNGNNRWLWLEYRQPIGYDATLSAFSTQFDDGALGHYENPAETVYASYSRLVNFRAATNAGSFNQPALAAGQSWVDPYSELSLQVLSASAAGMSVRVAYDVPCAVLGPAYPTVGSAAGAATVTVTAPAGCGWAVLSNDNWLTVTSAASGTRNGTVSYSFTANAAVTARTGTISIGRQAYNVNQLSTNNPPVATSLSPAAGSAAPNTNVFFDAVFTDLDGANTLGNLNLWFTVGAGQTDACRVEYRRAANELRLYGDTNSSWQFSTPGVNSTMANTQCQINVGASTVIVTGTTLTLRVSVRFLAAFVGPRNIYGSATDAPGSVSPATLLGTVTIGTVNVTPTVGSVSPTGGSGATATFTIPFSDGNGAADLNVLNVLINSSLDGRNSCYFAYVRSANTLYLMNDAGSDLLPGLVLNGTGSTANTQCSATGAGSSATVSGTTLTLVLRVTFSSAYAGNRVVYAAGRDVASANSGWQALGVWQAPGAPVTSPAVLSTTPVAVSGTSATVTAVFRDDQGFADLNVLNILINNALDGRNACYLAYLRPTNTLYLVPDSGVDLLPGVVPGGTGLAANGQCSVLANGSSVTVAGNVLTLNVNLSMSTPAFQGGRIVYTAARDVAGNNSGWQATATWNVP
jgi:M6 family metalloprotease-like protein